MNISQHGQVKKMAEQFTIRSESSPDTPAVRYSQVDGFVSTKKHKVIPEGRNSKPIPVPSRRIWTRLKSGLFGWKKTKSVSDSSITSYEKSKHPEIFTHMRPKNSVEKSVPENSVIVPPKIFFGGVGGSAVTNNVTKKINTEGFRLSAENESSKQLPGGQNEVR